MKIVGQDKTLKEISTVIEIFKTSEAEIRPHIILTGPSGSGKTAITKHLIEKYDLNFLEINAAQLTKEGTSGNSLSKALSPLSNSQNRLTICFVDEWDKLFISGNSNSNLAHETTNGVQNEFLKVLESDNTSVFGDYGKYININTKNVLFIFAGAFNGEENISLDRLQELGIKTEFLGRVGLVYNLQQLTLTDLYSILEDSPLLEKYLTLYPKVDSEKVILNIKEYLKETFEENTIGARTINTLIHKWFLKGGKLVDSEVKKITFQKTLSLNN
jgi:ATP-dependent protease Clp ATPase subunit